ncbi:MAG: protein-tyrosine phosphatase family protein [Janthinobacterium lividum]
MPPNLHPAHNIVVPKYAPSTHAPKPGMAKPAPAALSASQAKPAAPAPASAAATAITGKYLQEQKPLKKETALSRQLARFNEPLRADYDRRGKGAGMPRLDQSRHTAIRFDGPGMNANHFYLTDRSGNRLPGAVATACTYPNDQGLEGFWDMARAIKPSVIMVLAEDKDMKTGSCGYFRRDEICGEKVIKSRFVERDKESGAKLYMVTILEKGIELEIPVIHVDDWPDRSALGTARLKKVIEFMRRVEARGEPGEPRRIPLVHCKHGVGRTGQLIAQYLLMTRKNAVHSAEELIQTMRAQRDYYMLHAVEQQNSIGELAADLGIPVLARDNPYSLESVLDHMGVFARHVIPNYHFDDVLSLLKFEPEIRTMKVDDARSLLRKIASHHCPLRMELNTRALIWPTSSSMQCKDLHSGLKASLTPRALLHERSIAGHGNDEVTLTFLRPAGVVGDLANYAGKSRAYIQSKIMSDRLSGYEVDLETSEGRCRFLTTHHFDAVPLRLTPAQLRKHQAHIAADFSKAGKCMVDFKDHLDGNGEAVRYTFERISADIDAPLTGIGYNAALGPHKVRFDSFGKLVDLVDRQSRRDDGTSSSMTMVAADAQPD